MLSLMAKRMQPDAVPPAAFLRRELQTRLGSLTRHVERLDKEITKRISDIPVTASLTQILKSIPGIGQIVALTLTTELEELGLLTARQAGAFARESGSRQGNGACPPSAPMAQI